ncbi:MAG: GNAT family N-acetyltransferase [Bdellovibrionales bacterium]
MTKPLIQPVNATLVESVHKIFSSWQTLNSGQATFFSSWTPEQVTQELQDHFTLGAFQEQELKAVIFYRKTESAWEISQLATHPQAQRQGLMQALLLSLKGQLPPRQQLWLEVHEKNTPARRLYESAGFKQAHYRKSYYRDGGGACLYTYRK